MPFGSIAADRITGTNGDSISPESSVFRNRIINGAMVIDQRNNGSAVTVNDAAPYTLDRWFGEDVTDGAFTVQRVAEAPSGFSFSAKITVTTADASLAAGQYAVFTQRIEGFNTADLMWGTASASSVTFSFWVRSSLTGTFGGVLANGAENYSYPFTYTIASANTWEQKSITVAGPTAGTWIGATNGKGMIVTFGLGSGSTYVGTAGAWAAADYRGGATGQTNILATNGATWQVTGVQLEKGSTATSFDYRHYSVELAMCQRYYYELPASSQMPAYSADTTSVVGTVSMPVAMRATPSVTLPAGNSYAWYDGGYNFSTSTSISMATTGSNKSVYAISHPSFSTMTALRARILQSDSAYKFSAEL